MSAVTNWVPGVVFFFFVWGGDTVVSTQLYRNYNT